MCNDQVQLNNVMITTKTLATTVKATSFQNKFTVKKLETYGGRQGQNTKLNRNYFKLIKKT